MATATLAVDLAFALVGAGSASAAEPGARPLIVAHYMPWFVARPGSPQWGWHWTMNAFDPEQQASGRRQIASHYYPLIGPYDSSDPTVIEYHLLLMKLAGLDGVIVDWYGLSDFLDYPVLHRNTSLLFEGAARTGLQVGICYEDQTIPRLVAAGRLSAAERVRHAREEIDWLRRNWFAHPTYLKLKGRPVLLSFGADGLTDAEWEQVFSVADAAPLYLSEHRRRSVACGAFDWPLPQDGLAHLDTFYRSAQAGPDADTFLLPVAFPRFHDIYREGKAQAGYAQIPDDQGRTFAGTLERALKSGAPLVQIATWNDWGEGTVVEPSLEFGYRDLETVQAVRRMRDPGFVAQPDDLRLPQRLWQLRRQQPQLPQLTGTLDEIARRLAAGETTGSRSALERAEAVTPRAAP